jgi:type II secretory pathway component PulF
MPQYKVVYNTNTEKVKMIVIADSAEEATDKLDISLESVLSVTKEIIPASEKISHDNQITILSSLFSAALSGQDVAKMLQNSVNALYPKGVIADKINLLTAKGMSISELLEKMNFDEVAVRLVDAGEVSGSLDNGILEAEKYLELDSDVKAITSGGIAESFPFVLIGTALTLFFPIVLGEAAADLIKPKDANFFSHIMLYIYANLSIVLVGVGIFLLILISIKYLFWTYVKNVYPFSLFEQLILLKNSIVFLAIYTTLERHGVEVKKILNIYKKINPIIAQQLIENVDKGESLPTAILKADFPEDWSRTASSVLDFENRDAKAKAIEGLFNLLKKQITKQAQKANGLIISLGKGILIFALAMIGVGFYFPALVSQL